MEIRRKDAVSTIRFLQMDFTELIIKTVVIEHRDEYWKDVMRRIQTISEKYKGHDFAAHMLNAYLDYLEKLDKEIYQGEWIHDKRADRGDLPDGI